MKKQRKRLKLPNGYGSVTMRQKVLRNVSIHINLCMNLNAQ